MIFDKMDVFNLFIKVKIIHLEVLAQYMLHVDQTITIIITSISLEGITSVITTTTTLWG
ncbi:MAG: hypothetical protein ABIO60_02855 [Aquaticitalea sp.]